MLAMPRTLPFLCASLLCGLVLLALVPNAQVAASTLNPVWKVFSDQYIASVAMAQNQPSSTIWVASTVSGGAAELAIVSTHSGKIQLSVPGIFSGLTLGSNGQTLFAINETNNNIETIYYACAMSASTLKPLWSVILPLGEEYFSTYSAAEGPFYYQYGGTFVALDPKTGNQLWSANVGEATVYASSVPAVILSTYPNISALDATTGATLWTYEAACRGGGRGAISLSSVVSDDSVVFALWCQSFSSATTIIISLNAATGKTQWSVSQSSSNVDFPNMIAVDSNGTTYAGMMSNTSQLMTISAIDGSGRIKYTIGVPPFENSNNEQSLFLAGGMLYYESFDVNAVYVYSATNGAPIANLPNLLNGRDGYVIYSGSYVLIWEEGDNSGLSAYEWQ